MPRKPKLAATVLDEKTGLHVLPNEYDRFHVGKRFPYENARRAGKTHPELVEVIGESDPRSRFFRRTPAWFNRRMLRSRVARHPGTFTTRRSSARRPHRAEEQDG